MKRSGFLAFACVVLITSLSPLVRADDRPQFTAGDLAVAQANSNLAAKTLDSLSEALYKVEAQIDELTSQGSPAAPKDEKAAKEWLEQQDVKVRALGSVGDKIRRHLRDVREKQNMRLMQLQSAFPGILDVRYREAASDTALKEVEFGGIFELGGVQFAQFGNKDGVWNINMSTIISIHSRPVPASQPAAK